MSGAGSDDVDQVEFVSGRVGVGAGAVVEEPVDPELCFEPPQPARATTATASGRIATRRMPAFILGSPKIVKPLPPSVLDLFLELAAIPSPSGNERPVADRVGAYLTELGLGWDEDSTGPSIGSDSGNIFCRLPGRGSAARRCSSARTSTRCRPRARSSR